MASLIQDPSGRSPYWICVCSTFKEGRPKRVWRTTKVRIKPLKAGLKKADLKPDGSPMTARDLRAKAEEVCRAIEQDFRIEQQGEVTEHNLRRILSETLERVEGRPLAHPSVKEWLEQWLETRTGTIADKTRLKYHQVANDFLRSLDGRRNAKLESIGLNDFLEFRNQLLTEGRTPQTVNQLVGKVLASPFTLAVKLGLLGSNPLAHLSPLKTTRVEKDIFSPEEIVKLVGVAKGDWKGLILAAYYTGGRLVDLARLKWSALDLNNKTITFWQRKTEGKSSRAKVKLPIHPELETHLIAGPMTDEPNAPVFPELYPKTQSSLSKGFTRIMKEAGIEAGLGRARAGAKGRSFSLRSFHSLRHSFISALANAGVSSELRRKLSGHSTEESHAVYTHHELETIRQAVAAIPRLPAQP
jgi:integrase